MSKFVELRFGQGDMGKSISNRQDVEDGELFIQRELVPIEAIKDMYIILPEKRNIRITFENRGHIFSRIEYYKNEIDCLKRWTILRRACGITVPEVSMSPVPLPMDVEKVPEKYFSDGVSTKETERKFCGCTWNDLDRVLSVICKVEDKVEMTKQELDDYDIAVQCVSQIMNRMNDGKPIDWD